jgi:hypothetical protein
MRARSGAAIGGRAQRLEMLIGDAGLRQGTGQRRLGKAGPARERQGAHVGQHFHPCALERDHASSVACS